MTLLTEAIKRDAPIVELEKILKKTDVNAKDREEQTPLHAAAQKDNAPAMLLLLKQGADVNAKDMNGWTPIHCAADSGHFGLCEILLQQGNIQLQPNKDGNGPLVYLVRQKLAGDINLYTFFNVLNLMIEKGVNVNAANRYGEAPLHSACLRGNIHSIRFLIQHQANVNMLNSLGESSLHYAVRAARTDVVEMLLEAGADANIPSEQGTPLEIATRKNMTDIQQLLAASLSKGLNAEAHKGAVKTGNLMLMTEEAQWEQFFFVIKPQWLAYFKSPLETVPARMFELKRVFLKDIPLHETGDRNWCFKLTVGDQSLLLQARSESAKQEWMRALNVNAAAADVEEWEVNVQEQTDLKTLVQNHANHANQGLCADCRSCNSEWVAVKHGILICLECAGIHQELGVSKLKTIELSTWSFEEVEHFRKMTNVVFNSHWEHNLNEKHQTRPLPDDSRDCKKKFIRSKYLEKSFYESSSKSKNLDKLKRYNDTLLLLNFNSTLSQKLLNALIHELSISPRTLSDLEKCSLHAIWSQLTSSSTNNDGNVLKEVKKVLEASNTFAIGSNMAILSALYDACIVVKHNIFSKHHRRLSTVEVNSCVKNLLVEIERSALRHDLHSQAIFRFWLIQLLQILSVLQQKDVSRQVRKEFGACFLQHSVVALVLLSGSYLQSKEIEGVPPNASSIAKEFQAIQIKSNAFSEQCNKLGTTNSYFVSGIRPSMSRQISTTDFAKTEDVNSLSGDPNKRTGRILMTILSQENLSSTAFKALVEKVLSLDCAYILGIQKKGEAFHLNTIKTNFKKARIQQWSLLQQEIMAQLVERLFSIQKFAAHVRKVLSEQTICSTDRLQFYSRQALILYHLVAGLQSCVVPFCSFESLDCWRRLRELLGRLVQLQFKASQLDDRIQSSCLAMMMLHIQWGTSHLMQPQVHG